MSSPFYHDDSIDADGIRGGSGDGGWQQRYAGFIRLLRSTRGDIVKTFILPMLLAATWGSTAAADFTTAAVADNFQVERRSLGSGTPGIAEMTGTEAAEHVADGLYHVSNFLPGFPTAATIWPREVPVKCALDHATQRKTCTGYHVIPAIGRGEYIFIRPVDIPEPPPPQPVMVVTPPEPKPLPVTVKKPLG